MKIIIIGAGQGLGKVLSKMLRVRGHEVVSGFRNMNSDGWTKEAGILGLPMDVTDQEQLKAAAGAVKEQLGEVDAVVDVAGVLLDSDRTQNLMEEPLEDVRQHLEVNAIGVLAAFRAFYPILKKAESFWQLHQKVEALLVQAVCSQPMAFPKQQQIKSYRRCGLRSMTWRFWPSIRAE